MAEHAKVISPDSVEFPKLLESRFQWPDYRRETRPTMLLVARFGYGGRITQSVTAHCPPMIQTGRNELHNPAIEGWQNENPIAI